MMVSGIATLASNTSTEPDFLPSGSAVAFRCACIVVVAIQAIRAMQTIAADTAIFSHIYNNIYYVTHGRNAGKVAFCLLFIAGGLGLR